MTADDLRATLSQDAFLKELHHLLWIDPFKKGDLIDFGWNCRDHALIVAGVAMHFGFDVLAVTGKAAIIRGPAAENRVKPFGIEQRFHTWLSIPGVGTVDASPNLASIKQLGANYSTFAGIIGSEVVPHKLAIYYPNDVESKYNAAFDAATNIDSQLSLIYLTKYIEPIVPAQIDTAFQWCNSPLTVRLKNLKVSKGAYRKVVEHLVQLLDNSSASIAAMPQMAAWKKLAKGN